VKQRAKYPGQRTVVSFESYHPGTQTDNQTDSNTEGTHTHTHTQRNRSLYLTTKVTGNIAPAMNSYLDF